MVRIEIPRSYYTDTLPKSSHADAIEAEVQPPVGSARGVARLKLWPHTDGLTNPSVSVSMPRTTIGAPTARPYPPDLTASLPGTRGRCAWRHGLARKGQLVTYEVPFSTRDPNTLRFEFRFDADELERPVVLTVDLTLTEAQLGGAEVQAEKIKLPVEAKREAGSS